MSETRFISKKFCFGTHHTGMPLRNRHNYDPQTKLVKTERYMFFLKKLNASHRGGLGSKGLCDHPYKRIQKAL
jgi:hypothetical protein